MNESNKIQNSNNSGREIFAEAKQQARVAGKNISAKAGSTAREAKTLAYEQAERQKMFIAHEARNVNTALLKTAEELESPALERQIRGLAGRINESASRLEDAAIEEVVEAVEDFSRTQPALFIGASFAVGLMLGRFLNASQRVAAQEPVLSSQPTVTTSEEVHHNEREQPLLNR